jgi:5-methylcytosine-specific restriction endonuclease McrA
METKFKKGYEREDGMVFHSYGKSYKGGEYWLTKEEFQNLEKKRKENAKRYFSENKDKIAKKREKRMSESKEKYAEMARSYALKHKAKRKEYYKRYCEEHKDRVALSNKRWREKNWGRMSGLLAMYRARRRSQTPDLTAEQKKIIGVFFEQAVRLKKTLGIPFEVDHIVPISLGGSHHPCNLQVMPMRLNRVKHNRGIFRWEEKNEKII